MVLGLQIIREIVQALLRVWNKKDEGNRNGKPALAGDGAARQSPGTPSRLANVQTIHGRPLNAAGLRAVEHRCLMPTVMGHCGTAKTTRPDMAEPFSVWPRKLRSRRSSCRKFKVGQQQVR